MEAWDFNLHFHRCFSCLSFLLCWGTSELRILLHSPSVQINQEKKRRKKSNFDGNTHTAKGSCITFIFCCKLLSPTLVKYSVKKRSTFNFHTCNNLLYLLSNYQYLLYSNLFFYFSHLLYMGEFTTHELKSKSVCVRCLFLNWLRHSARNLKNIFHETQLEFSAESYENHLRKKGKVL